MLLPERYIPRARIVEGAYGLLRSAHAQELWDGTTSIPVELIAESILGLQITWEELGGTADRTLLGALQVRTRTLWLNESERELFEKTPGLERFTIAHELGHLRLHVDPAHGIQTALASEIEAVAVLCRDGDRSQREIQAEVFAASLLMPEDLVRSHASSTDTGSWSHVYWLRTQFGVSATAMRNRLRDLGYRTPDDPTTRVRLSI